MSRVYSTGRRKSATARVWLKVGSGKIVVNNKDLLGYFQRPTSEMIVKQPLTLLHALTKYDIVATVKGSGLSAQAGALRHGISRALQKLEPSYRSTLKAKGLLTRDAREKERKKYGLAGARKKFQFSKR